MPKRTGVRHLQAVLLWLCLAISNIIQGNAAVADIVMLEQVGKPLDDESLSKRIYSSFFFFFPITHILSGYLGTAINNKRFLLFNGLYCSILSYMTPTLFKMYGWNALYVIRVTQGLTQGFVMPQVYGQMMRWIPPDEFSFLGPITVSGSFAGTFFINVMGGFLGELKGGWESIFYLSGHCCLLWCFAFAGLGAQEPETCWYISAEERALICLSLAPRAKTSFRRHVPWRGILTSLPPYAIIISHAVQNWGFQTLVEMVPTIMHQNFKQTFPMTGFITGLPFLLPVIAIVPFSYLGDFLLSKSLINLETLRFTANSIGQYGMGIGLIFMSFSEELSAAMACLCSAVLFGTCQLMGVYMNHFDLAPNFANFVFGWTSGLGHICSILGPYVSRIIYHSYDNIDSAAVLFICGINYILGNLFYIMTGSVEVQSYNAYDTNTYFRRR